MKPPFSLVSLLGPLAPPVDVIDVGAMWNGEESVDYANLVHAAVARVVGFEPVQAECDRLNAMNLPGHRFLPYFIGDGRPGTFRVCNANMSSSLYEPNLPLLGRFTGLANLNQVTAREPVQTRALDDIPEITGADFIKLDIQGAEADALRGATRTLGGTLAVHVECEFVPMYTGQPLFGDIDVLLRARGFFFHHFASVWGWPFAPFEADQRDPARQALWCDAVYLRDFMAWGSLTPAQLLKLAVILHEVYGSFDTAAFALHLYDRATGTTIWRQYAQRLTS